MHSVSVQCSTPWWLAECLNGLEAHAILSVGSSTVESAMLIIIIVIITIIIVVVIVIIPMHFVIINIMIVIRRGM